MGNKDNLQEFMEYRQWKRKNLGLGPIDDWYVDSKFLKSFDNIWTCKFCYKPLHAIDYDARRGDIQLSCDTPKCPGNFIDGPRDMHPFTKWARKVGVKNITNQYLLDDQCG